MEEPAKRGFSCLECPSRPTGWRNLKRHYFELHSVVPRMERPPLKNDAFGLDMSQLRLLSSNDKVDAIMMTKTRHPYAGERKKEAQTTSRASSRLLDHQWHVCRARVFCDSGCVEGTSADAAC